MLRACRIIHVRCTLDPCPVRTSHPSHRSIPYPYCGLPQQAGLCFVWSVLHLYSSRINNVPPNIPNRLLIIPGIKYRGLPKSGISGHFGAKYRYILKPSTSHAPGALRLASVTSHLFLRYTWFGLLCLAFNCFWRILNKSEAIQ